MAPAFFKLHLKGSQNFFSNKYFKLKKIKFRTMASNHIILSLYVYYYRISYFAKNWYYDSTLNVRLFYLELPKTLNLFFFFIIIKQCEKKIIITNKQLTYLILVNV